MSNDLVESLQRAFDRESIFRRNGLTSSPFQSEILNPGTDRFWLIACGRRSGKTTAVAGLISHTALCFGESSIILSAPSERQVKEILRIIKSLIRGAGYFDEVKSESQTLLEFRNHSRVLGVPGGRSENVRVFNADLAVIDEAAYCPDDLYTAVMPMLATNPQSRFFALGTPFGRDNWFGRQWLTNDRYRKVRVKTSEVGRVDEEFLAQQRDDLGPALFAQEFEADFGAGNLPLIDPAVLDRVFQPLGRISHA